MKTGILLVNLGTPDEPTASAVRHYLQEFLSDPRVVELPRLLWLPLLYGIIVPLRLRRTLKNYQKIWTNSGSPLSVNSRNLAHALANNLQEHHYNTEIAVAMRYGKPSIAAELRNLRQHQCEKIIILPLFPQYSSTTTASVFDAVSAELQHWRVIPELTMLTNYARHPAYIAALAQSVQNYWQQHQPSEHLLISFHGLPKRNITAGDPYQDQCMDTAKRLAEKLNLPHNKYTVVFQSRFGAAEWLQPYCDKTLMKLPKEGIKTVDVVCPGFAVDCLETLEEMAKTNAELFHAAGGKQFRYIPALNDSQLHQDMLVEIVSGYLS